MDSQYKLLSELLSDQAAFITSPKTSLANYWGALSPAPPAPSVYGLGDMNTNCIQLNTIRFDVGVALFNDFVNVVFNTETILS